MKKKKYPEFTSSNIQWDRDNRSVTDDPNGPLTSDEDVASAMGAGHPKCAPPSIQQPANVLPGSPGSGSAPGANGPSVTASVGPGGPMGMD